MLHEKAFFPTLPTSGKSGLKVKFLQFPKAAILLSLKTVDMWSCFPFGATFEKLTPNDIFPNPLWSKNLLIIHLVL